MVIELQSLKGSRKTELCMLSPYFPNLNVLFLLTDVSYRCRKCCVFLSFSYSFYYCTPLDAVAKVKLDMFSSIIKHIRKKCKRPPPLDNFAQGFRLFMVLIVIQHDQKIRKSAENIVFTHSTVSRGSARLFVSSF